MFHIFLFLAFICHYFSIIHRSGAFYFRIYALRQTTYTPNVACEVIKAENVRSGRRGENRLYCKGEIFRIADDWQTGRTRSADMYVALSELPKGKNIYLDVWGVRFGLTNSMRTAIDWRK